MVAKLYLPYMGSQEDIDKILPYLKTKPMGVREGDIKAALGAKYVDNRKYDFYNMIGLFTRDKGLYRLTQAGINYSNADPSNRAEIIQSSISKCKPYFAILEWAYHNRADILEADNTRLYWVQNFEQDVDLSNKYRLDAAPLTFFSLCQIAGIGTFIIGRRGGKSRLEINKDMLNRFIERCNSATSLNDPAAGDPRPDQSLDPNTLEEKSAERAPTLAERQNDIANNSQNNRYTFNLPIFGNIAQIIWVEPTFTKEEWTKLKKIGDAMFLDED